MLRTRSAQLNIEIPTEINNNTHITCNRAVSIELTIQKKQDDFWTANEGKEKR